MALPEKDLFHKSYELLIYCKEIKEKEIAQDWPHVCQVNAEVFGYGER